MFGLIKKKDPICGMKQEKGKGIMDEETGKWFCSEHCKQEYYEQKQKTKKEEKHQGGCCH